MTYKWKDNLACKATYVILEDLLDQFEEILVPRKTAGNYKVEFFTNYPDDASSKLKEKWAKKIAAKFIQYVLKFYDVRKQTSSTTVKKWYKETWPIFKDGNNTLTDLAETLDKHCKFSDE